MQAAPEARLVSLAGGDKRNAIPRESSALLAVGGALSGGEVPGTGGDATTRSTQTAGFRCCEQAITGAAHTTLPTHTLPPPLRLQVPVGQVQAVQAAVAQRLASYQQEFGIKEPQLAISAAQANEAPAQCLAPAAAGRLLDLLLTLPHGVMKYSHAVAGEGGWRGCMMCWMDCEVAAAIRTFVSQGMNPMGPMQGIWPGHTSTMQRTFIPSAGLVETSTNLASIKPQLGSADGRAEFAVQCSTRSSLMPALEQVG